MGVSCSVYRYGYGDGESRQRSHIPPSRRCLVLVRSRQETLVPLVWSSACTSRAGKKPGAPKRLQTKSLTPSLSHIIPPQLFGWGMPCAAPHLLRSSREVAALQRLGGALAWLLPRFSTPEALQIPGKLRSPEPPHRAGTARLPFSCAPRGSRAAAAQCFHLVAKTLLFAS